jgi:hypothetical protein
MWKESTWRTCHADVKNPREKPRVMHCTEPRVRTCVVQGDMESDDEGNSKLMIVIDLIGEWSQQILDHSSEWLQERYDRPSECLSVRMHWDSNEGEI